MSGELMEQEMEDQPAVLSRLCERFEHDRQRLAVLVPAELCGVAFVARGSSDNAAVLGRYLAELTSGRPASLVAPSLHTRYRAEVDYRGQLVVALSQSGETPEIVETARRLRERGARLVAVSNDSSSALSSVAELTLALDAGSERAVPATKTVTAEMLLMLTIAAALGDLHLGSGKLGRLPDAIGAILADDLPARELARRWAGADRLLVIGRGLCYASALETALKVREVDLSFAQALSSADLLHGPIASVGASLPVLMIDGGGPASGDIEDAAERLQEAHADVAWCTASPRAALSLPAGLPEPLQAIAATVRGQQLALAGARARGLEPDHPAGLSKVTRTS